MEVNHNVVGWFEIPVVDMGRAIRFYETVFGFTLAPTKSGALEMALFPGMPGTIGTGGSLVHQTIAYKPSPNGTLIYFTAFSGDAAVELSRVDEAGGRLLLPKTLITEEVGYMGLFLDSEGNRIGIHSRQ